MRENGSLTPFQQSPETAPSELVAVVDDLLNQLGSKFSNISSELIGKCAFGAAVILQGSFD